MTANAARRHDDPVPEMDRLTRALVGDWNTTEKMDRGEMFPNGGSRSGSPVVLWANAKGEFSVAQPVERMEGHKRPALGSLG